MGAGSGRPADARAAYLKGQARSGRDGAGLDRDADGSQAVGDRALSGTSSGQIGPPRFPATPPRPPAPPNTDPFAVSPSPCRFRRAPLCLRRHLSGGLR